MPSGVTLEQLIGLPALMGLMHETTAGLPDPIPASFDKPKRQIIGNSARLFVDFGQRRSSRFVKYGAPALTAGLENLAARDYVLLSTTEVQPIDPLSFQRLHMFDSYDMQKMGAGEVARQVGLFKKKFDNARKIAKWSVLRYGAVYLDSSGNILPSSSGAATDGTCDFSLPAGHQNQLNVEGSGNIIANLWSDNTNANIPKQIEDLQAVAARETGLELKYAFYGSEVPGYIRKNSYVASNLVFDPQMYRALNSSTSIPQGFLGLTWIPVAKAFFEDQTGTKQVMFGAKEVIFTPDPGVGDWWELEEGSMLVPNSIDISQRSAETILANAQTVFGQWATSRYEFNGGISMNNYVGDNFLYALKNPKAIYRAAVAT